MMVTFTKGFIYRNKKFITDLTIDAHNKIRDFVKDKRSIQIDLPNLIDGPEGSIQQLIEFLKINPTKEQIKAALEFIHPELITSEVNNNNEKEANGK